MNSMSPQLPYHRCRTDIPGVCGAAVEVVCGTDAPFLPYCAAMIESLVGNADGTNYNVSVLFDSDIPESQVVQMEAFLSPRVGYRLLRVTDEDLAAVSIPHAYLPRSVYFRLLIDKYLPEELERILFLDCDIYVATSLKDLWDTDLRGNACAAVEIEYIDPWHLKEIGLANGPYFNAGVMLIDMHKWRAENIGARAAEWILRNLSVARFWDQDALNVMFSGRTQQMDGRYNVTTNALNTYGGATAPAIVHFTGRDKPWHYLSANPYKRAYLDCVRRTPWPEARCVDFSWANVARKYIPESVKRNLRASFIWKVLRRNG